MKHNTKLFFAAAVAALGLASCAKEVAPVETPNDNLVTVHFGATAGIEGATKATLTPNEQETLFTSDWENGDALSVKYSFDYGASKETTATWSADKSCFEAQIGGGNGIWIYDVLYPTPKEVSFGSERTQNGNNYNSKYDLMCGSATADGADAGKTADDKDIVFEMTRQTAIAYFHFTSALDEKVVSAKLSVEGDGAYLSTSDVQIGKDDNGNIDYAKGYTFNETEGVASKEINLTFTGEAPKSSDFKLWFNVLPTIYNKMTLTVETTNHTLTISRTATDMYEAGKLYKVVKKEIPAEKWAPKAAYTGGDLVFDFKTHPEGWPAEENKNAGNYDYELSGVKYAFNLSSNVYCKGTSGNNGYLMISGKNDNALLGLPAISGFKLTKIVATINDQVSSVSSKTMVAITDGVNVVAGGAEQNWKTKGAVHTYTLTETEENTVYYMYATKANAQMMKLVLSYEPATPSAPKYSVSFASVEGGTLSASAIKAEEGAEITLTAEPQLGYEFNNDWSVTAADGTVINVVDNKFTMPAQDVTVSGTFTLNIKYDHAGTENDPYNVLDVLKLIETLETNAISSEINAKGIIKSITEVSTAYKNATYTIGDETTSETVTIYRGKYINGADFTSTDQIKIGDEVVIKGKVTNYKGSKQFSAGSMIVSLKRMETCATPVINIDENGVVSITCATDGATIRYTAGDAPADPTESSDVFNSATLNDGQTIKAIAFAEGYKPSAVASKKYTVGGAALTEKTATIQFGTNNVKIDKESVIANDDQQNSWTITTISAPSFTQQPTYSQVGSKKKGAAKSITFTTTLPKDAEVTSIETKFGGFAGTKGDITLKVGDISVGNATLNEGEDVITKSSTTSTGNTVTITVTNIANGVKCYNIQVKYKTAN